MLEPRLAARTLVFVIVFCPLVTSCASVETVPPEPPPPQDQVLRPGDLLRIEVWRQPEYSGEFAIGVDGRLLHPLYQEVPLEGLPVFEVRREIQRFLSDYIEGARLVVEPVYRVSVGGEVRQPAVYQVDRGSTVAEAIALAGGPTVLARLDEVLLVRSGTQYTLRLGDDLITFGQLPIVSGDQIFLDRQSQFNLWRDVIGPVATLAALVLSSLRIGQVTGG